MPVTIIAAVASNRVIGNNGGLPWRLSDDLKRFKLITTHHIVVMGRKTWESIPGGKLPGRTIYVLSRQTDFAPEDVAVFSSPLDAVEAAGDRELFVAGGSEVYRAFLPLADKLFLTHVHAMPAGDTLFPKVDWSQWRSVAWEQGFVDAKNEHESSFETYIRMPSDNAV